MPAPRGLSFLPVYCCNSFRCPPFELGVPQEGQIFTSSPVADSPRDHLDGISVSDSLDRTSGLCVEGRDPETTMKPIFTLQQAEIGRCVADCVPLNPSDDFGDSPREGLFAKLDADISEETQMKPKGCCRKLGAALKEVTSGKPDCEKAVKCLVGPKAHVWLEADTTVMLRNIPNRYTVEEIVAELKAKNFEGLFDFIYLPIDFQLKKNKGYAFINFNCPRTRTRFVSVFDRCALTRYATRKILRVDPAVNQGFEENMAKYSTKDAARITNEWFRPMIFSCTKDSIAEGLQ